MLDKEKAFTVIEILIIVLIIGLLASIILIGLSSTRNKAKDNSFKSTMKSIQTNLVSCCLNGDVDLLTDVDGPICTGGENYPGAESIGSISAGGCVAGNFLKRFTPGEKNSGNCTRAEVTVENIIYTDC